MRRFFELVVRFRRDESGAFAVIFGVIAIVLVTLSGAVVDYVALQQARSRAQIALDAAALALQPEINKRGVSEEMLRQRAEAFVIDRIGDPRIAAKVDRSSIDLDTGRLFLGGEFTMPTMFVSLVGFNELSAAFSAEAMQGSVNLEVSLSLDVTGSMAGTRIRDLKVAAKELVDVILQNNRGETTAKIALVPYSQAVNAGTYATALRGPIRAAKGISDITWATGSARSISDATDTSPVKITSNNHDFQNGDWVYVSGVSSLSQINNKAFQVEGRTRHSFELKGSSRSWNAGYSGGGSVTKCQKPDCGVVVTSNGHGFTNGEYVVVSEVGGMTGLNGYALQVSEASVNTLVLNGVPAGGGGTYAARTGKMDCTWQKPKEACRYYLFTTAANSSRIEEITTCVTERAGNPFNDQPPSVTYVGRNYPTSPQCPNSPIIPLTTVKKTLDDAINALPATGNTAGSLGILWSWYMLSPNFGYVWPEDRRPEPYGTKDVLKAAIIMTDGEFNTVHFDGVPSRDSPIGGQAYLRHSKNAHNGPPYAQAKAYCDAMRTAKITVYTVGFDIGKGTQAANIMAYCATEPANYYAAENGDQLKEAFQQIARNISALRLTQ
jgi:Flp pilus assembly pilin Flp